MTTKQLFETTNRALLAGDFVTAREGLEALARRADHCDLFCQAAAYLARFPSVQHRPLADRLREADRAAQRNGEQRAAAAAAA